MRGKGILYTVAYNAKLESQQADCNALCAMQNGSSTDFGTYSIANYWSSEAGRMRSLASRAACLLLRLQKRQDEE